MSELDCFGIQTAEMAVIIEIAVDCGAKSPNYLGIDALLIV
jgi:hypothetical protein